MGHNKKVCISNFFSKIIVGCGESEEEDGGGFIITVCNNIILFFPILIYYLRKCLQYNSNN